MSTVNAATGEIQYTPKEIEMVQGMNASSGIRSTVDYDTAKKALEDYGGEYSNYVAVARAAENDAYMKNKYGAAGADTGFDYRAAIDYAKSLGNNEAAAWYEKTRNNKIDYLNANGLNSYQAEKSGEFADYNKKLILPGYYTRYLDKSYARAPQQHTDDTIDAGIAASIKSMEAAGNYEGANKARQELLYRKNYETGQYEQLVQPDWRGYSLEDWARLSSDGGSGRTRAAGYGYGVEGVDPAQYGESYWADRSNAVSPGGALRVTGGAAGGNTISYADYAKMLATGQSTDGSGTNYAALTKTPTTYIGSDGTAKEGYTRSGYLENALTSLNDLYESAMANNDTVYAAQLKQAIAALQMQEESANQGYDAANKQLYVDMMLAQKNLPQQLAAMGIKGGLTESSLIDLMTQYENGMNSNEQARQNALAELAYQQLSAQQETAIAQAQAQQAAQESYYTNYASLMSQLQSQANYQNELADANAKQAQADAQNLISYLSSIGVQPTAEQLAAAYGLTGEQAAAALGEQGVQATPTGNQNGDLSGEESGEKHMYTAASLLSMLQRGGASDAEVLAKLYNIVAQGRISDEDAETIFARYSK